MVDFFHGVLSAFLIFSACYALSVFIVKYKRLSAPSPTPQTENQTRVYYITSKPKRKKQNKQKQNNIALKGALIPDGTVIMADKTAITKSSPKKQNFSRKKSSKKT